MRHKSKPTPWAHFYLDDNDAVECDDKHNVICSLIHLFTGRLWGKVSQSSSIHYENGFGLSRLPPTTRLSSSGDVSRLRRSPTSNSAKQNVLPNEPKRMLDTYVRRVTRQAARTKTQPNSHCSGVRVWGSTAAQQIDRRTP
jgi:hypothetical protein